MPLFSYSGVCGKSPHKPGTVVNSVLLRSSATPFAVQVIDSPGASSSLGQLTTTPWSSVTTTPVTAPTNGSLTLNADGSYTYTHDGSEISSDSFVYEVCDSEPLCDTAIVTITITPVSDTTPVANADSITVAEGGTATLLDGGAGNVLVNDAGLGDTPVTVSLVTDVTQGSLTLNADGTWRTAPELRELWAQALGGDQIGPINVMCGSGVTACHLIISARLAGLPEPRLYVGSWSEWIEDSSRPVARGIPEMA